MQSHAYADVRTHAIADSGTDALSDSIADAQLDHTHSHAPANNCSIRLTLDASGGLHGRGLVELGHLLGHVRRRHRVSHTQCATADYRQRRPVPGDRDSKSVQHGSLPCRLCHQSAVKSPNV